jgi:hypothetical protein
MLHNPMTAPTWNLQPGDILVREQIHDQYGGNPQAGISRSSSTPNVLVSSDYDKAAAARGDHRRSHQGVRRFRRRPGSFRLIFTSFRVLESSFLRRSARFLRRVRFPAAPRAFTQAAVEFRNCRREGDMARSATLGSSAHDGVMAGREASSACRQVRVVDYAFQSAAIARHWAQHALRGIDA